MTTSDACSACRSAACVRPSHWGVQAAQGDIIVVMDGDLQHDPALIPGMLEALQSGADIVSGSRFLAGRRAAGLPSDLRQKLSDYGNRLTNLLLGKQLTDPLTGFFATSRRLFLGSLPRMQADGFKVFFDLVYQNRQASTRELAFDFQRRQHGESKFHLYVLWLLLCDVASKLSGGLLPPRLISFVGVGLIGSIGHFSVLYASLALGLVFWLSQAIATVVAMVFNFAINNVLTYYADRLRGVAFYKGLLLYSIIASVGIVANVSTAQITYQRFEGHTFVAASMGLVIDIMWRFVVSNWIDLGTIIDPEEAPVVSELATARRIRGALLQPAVNFHLCGLITLPQRRLFSSRCRSFRTRVGSCSRRCRQWWRRWRLSTPLRQAAAALSTAPLRASPGAWA